MEPAINAYTASPCNQFSFQMGNSRHKENPVTSADLFRDETHIDRFLSTEDVNNLFKVLKDSKNIHLLISNCRFVFLNELYGGVYGC